MANQPQQPDTALHNASHLMQYHDLIKSIVAALDARDAYTASHSDRVADMVLVLAAALGLDEDETTRIHMAAHLHDIGKIAVPDSVLRKAGPLTRPEWEEMRRHPVTGYEILRKIDDFKEISILVRHHHERWDGRGYPDGLSGHDIPPGSRVIAVADSIDAMMSSRSYRPAMTSAACRREIEKTAASCMTLAWPPPRWNTGTSWSAAMPGPTRPARPTLTVCSWSTPARRTIIC